MALERQKANQRTVTNKLVKELDTLGINEFSLFGDLDHLGKYLCNKQPI